MSTIDKIYDDNTSRTVRTIREEINSGYSSSEGDARSDIIRSQESIKGRKSRGLII